MGVEILTNDSTNQTVEDATEQNNALLSDMDKNVKLGPGQSLEGPVNVGLVDSTHDTNGSAKAEADGAKSLSPPKDAVDEWPAPKQIHTFYFVKYQSYEDPKLKAKLEQVDKEIQKRNKERFQITEALKEKRAERSQVISQLKPLTAEDKQYRVVIDGKIKEMEPLHAALGKLRTANNVERGICSSEEELDSLIQSLHYRIQHESNTLAEEKQLLKDIKQLEGTREKVIAHAAVKAKLQDSLGPKEAIQDQVKLIGVDLDGVRKEHQAIRSKIRNLEDILKAIDEDIGSLQQELAAVTQKKDKAYETLNEHRKARDEVNALYYQNRSLLNNARDIAAKKDVAALEELSNREVEKFMSQWSGDKAFRDDYERRILLSLDRRQLTRDGRMRNADEKPIVSEAVTSIESEMLTLAGSRKVDVDVKPLNIDVDAKPAQHVSSKKAPKDDAKKSTGAEINEKATPEDTQTFSLPEKGQKDSSAAPVIDAAKLKEMKREEEMAKAKLASERKKKLADKAAAKAAARVQKEAEKKQKEREKRAKRKAGVTALDTPDEQTEDETKAEESLQQTEAVDTPVPSKIKEQKENVRYRTRSKGLDQRPRIIIPKRKKLQSYWPWAALAATSVLVLLFLGYYYLGRN